MLSFIYRMVHDFESTHGMRPNLLYLNEQQVQHLRDDFDECYDLRDIANMLGMEMIVDRGVLHPHVAWTRLIEAKAAAG